MLMATSLVSGATALKIGHQPAPSTDGAPAFTYPSFRYVAHVSDMQDAWRRARLSNVSDDVAVQPASEVATLTQQAVLDGAQRAMTRAQQANREAAAVRGRAEELSRRFGAGGAVSAADLAPAAVTVPTATASVNTDVNPSDGDVAQPVANLPAPADEHAAHNSIAAWKDRTQVIEHMPTKPAKPTKTNPRRPPSAASLPLHHVSRCRQPCKTAPPPNSFSRSIS